MATDSLAQVADELYGLDPGEFVAARDDVVRRLRNDGNRDLAEQVKRLSRPSASAWCVNQLVRERPEDVRAFGDLAVALRQAQATLAAGDLRALARQRREIVASLLRSAEELAVRRGRSVSSATAEEIRGTLDAALSDPEIARSVMSGCLTAAVTYAGLGDVEIAVRGSTEPGQPRDVSAETSVAKEKVRPEAESRKQAEVRAAQATAIAAERKLAVDDARARLDDARRRRAAAERELATAVREVHELEVEVTGAKRAAEEAERDLRRRV